MIFKKWEPIDNLPAKLYLEALHDDYEGFRVLLKGEDSQQKMLRITFYPLSYRKTDEGDLLETVSQNDFSSWTLFTVTDSDYLEWFNRESFNIHDSDKIKHFAIYTPNDCLDIITSCPPEVEWLN